MLIKNIKFTTIYSWSKNQLILIKVSNLKIIFVSTYNLRKMSNWRKCQIWRKSQIWRKGRVWQKGQNWQKYHIWGENQIWEKCKISDLSSTSPPSSYSLNLVSNFCWTKKKFWETKGKKIWLWNNNRTEQLCDLDANLAIWATSRWKLLMRMQCSRGFIVLNYFHNSYFQLREASPPKNFVLNYG